MITEENARLRSEIRNEKLMKEQQEIRKDIENFDNKYGFADFNYYYNKYRNKVEQRYLKNNVNVNETNILCKIIEDKYSIYKIILWSVLLILMYIIVRRVI